MIIPDHTGVINKAVKVVKSCKTFEQLMSAYNFIGLTIHSLNKRYDNYHTWHIMNELYNIAERQGITIRTEQRGRQYA